MAAQKHNLIHYLFTIFYTLLKSLVSSIVWIAVGVVGLVVFQRNETPVNIVVGLPLLLAGAGVVFNKLSSVLFAIVYPAYNKGVCILCRK